MIRLVIKLHSNWRVPALLLCLSLLLFAAGSVAAQEGPAASTQAASVPYLPRSSGRHFYLTNLNYPTDQVLTACSPGYHTASIWEILDVSNLTYDVNHPDAHKKADQGYGPPSYWHGWVRTGWDANTSNVTGTGNCSNWTSKSNTAYGVSVRLSRTWETAPGDLSTWDANSFTCNLTGPVWCVMDVKHVYLPFMRR
jgi:hypothetical protein